MAGSGSDAAGNCCTAEPASKLLPVICARGLCEFQVVLGLGALRKPRERPVVDHVNRTTTVRRYLQ